MPETITSSEKLIPEAAKESILSGIMSNIRKVTARVRNGIVNVLEWTKKTAKGSFEILFPQVKEIEEFIMGKNGADPQKKTDEPPSPASIATAVAAASAAAATA